jgi:hypothetical protein
MNKTILDRAVATGTPIMVRERVGGDTFALTVTSYDRRIVRGTYEHLGRQHDAAFHRTDLITETR